MENRNGLAVGGCVTQATGHAEGDAALALLEDIPRAMKISVGGDKGYDQRPFVKGLRGQSATPHVAQKIAGSAIDARVTRHDGYAVSQKKGKRVEELFGWMKTVGMMRKTRHRGTQYSESHQVASVSRRRRKGCSGSRSTTDQPSFTAFEARPTPRTVGISFVPRASAVC
jgi:hypothetical protein